MHDLALSCPPPTIASELCDLIEGLYMVWQVRKASAVCQDCIFCLINLKQSSCRCSVVPANWPDHVLSLPNMRNM